MKECPFCRYSGTDLVGPPLCRDFQIQCANCGARGSEGKDPKEAKELWNKRPEPVEL